ncbi:MAG: hypothetical protein DI530_12230 [Sphingomonas sp.]|uniref:hypothetical protein n=1 Tax=Sphingomonas sp. TaxID=28214 RepID=UPI000DBC09E2|nr:hypothetical protein [Sphingomonas sp.]PZU77752.1 MAG: hypothetical protein DI530_12230 [Sphingomonas sp.]
MPKHDDQAPAGIDTIEGVRGPIRRIADRFPDREPIDVALGALYAAHDLAQRAGMTAPEAIEWLRTAADLMERQLIKSAEAGR